MDNQRLYDIMMQLRRIAYKRALRGQFRNIGTPEDIAQEAVLLVLTLFPKWKEKHGNFEAYMRVCVIRNLWKQHRKGRLVKRPERIWKKEDRQEFPLSFDLSIEEKMEAKDSSSLYSALDKLCAKDKEALQIAYGFKGNFKNYKEAAESLGLTKHALISRCRRALQNLKEILPEGE